MDYFFEQLQLDFCRRTCSKQESPLRVDLVLLVPLHKHNVSFASTHHFEEHWLKALTACRTRTTAGAG